MVDLVKPSDLAAAATVFPDDAMVVDAGGVVRRATPLQVVNAGAPAASEAIAIAGTDNTQRMTALRTRQVLDNVTAPSVLRAAAWAESSTPPDPTNPDSKSSKGWAEDAEASADRAELISDMVGVFSVGTISDLSMVPAKLRDVTSKYIVKEYHPGSGVGGGTFYWSEQNHQSDVSADTQRGIYVAPSGQSGSGGAFVRLYDSDFCVTWFGARDGLSYNSSAAFLGAEDMAVNGEVITVPAGIFNISSSLCVKRRNDIQIAYRGAGRSATFLRWTGGAGRLVNAFNGWQYGFSFKGMTLETGATNPSQIVTGSMGFHIEFSQRPAVIEDITISGFDTNFDLGCHAQATVVRGLFSTQGNVLLDIYGTQSDMTVFEDCWLFGGVKAAVRWSGGRIFMLRPFIGPSAAWSTDPNYTNVQIGIREVRTEDIGKSPYLTPGRLITPRGSSLDSPRFEDNTGVPTTKRSIVFENFITTTTTVPTFRMTDLQFPNDATVEPIAINSELDGVTIRDVVMSKGIPALISDNPPSGYLTYVDLQGQFQGEVSVGPRSYVSYGDKSKVSSKVTSMLPIRGNAPIVAGSNVTLTNNAYGIGFRTEITSTGGATLFYATIPVQSATENLRLWIQGDAWRWCNIDVRNMTDGGTQLWRMNLVPASAFREGVALEVPNSAGKSVRLYITSADGVGSYFDATDLSYGTYTP